MNDREQALRLASGLAYAVGLIEGLGKDPGHARTVLEQWRNPQVQVNVTRPLSRDLEQAIRAAELRKVERDRARRTA